MITYQEAIKNHVIGDFGNTYNTLSEKVVYIIVSIECYKLQLDR